MSRPRIGILALQGDVREHAAALTAAGAEPVPVRRAAQLDDVAGLIFPGGESTAVSNLLGAFDLFDPIRDRLVAGMPAYGSCAGLILLARQVLDTRPDARSFGALDITVRRNAFGRQVDSFETDLAITGIAGPEAPVRAVFIRAPWVEATGAEVEILARVPAGPAAGRIVAVRQGAVLATSFHPEITGDHRVHHAFVDLVRGAG